MDLFKKEKKPETAEEKSKKTKKGCLAILIGAIFIIVIVIIAGTGGKKGIKPSSESTIYSVNQNVIANETRWKVLKVYTKDSLPKSFGRAEKATGKFVVVHIEVENLSKTAKTVSRPKLVDNQERIFTSSDADFELSGIKQIMILEIINPNLPFVFAEVYDVPTDAKGLKMKVRDLSHSWEEALISLGI